MTQTRSELPAPPTLVPTVEGLEDDPEGTRIVGEEIRLFSTVKRVLDGSGHTDISAAKGRAMDDERMLELRDHVAVAKPEDLPALFEQMHNLGALRAHRGRSVQGSVDRSSPYFAHIRLEEQVACGAFDRTPAARGKMSARRRDILIGARSYLDSSEGIRIVDWRHAPISRVYYRYAEGDEYEEELGDRLIEGRVLIRRGVSIVHRELVRVSAPQGTFLKGSNGHWGRTSAERALLETEAKWAARHGVAAEAGLGVGSDGRMRSDKHLPAIAALLDERQYELITRDAKGLVAIQGSAGSGKTTVGLHRVAYLAFQEAQRFRPDKMFIVVPNDALVHYVSRVLPSLGVEGVPVSTFAGFASRLVGQLFPRLPTKLSDETPAVVARAKSHAAMLRAIETYVGRTTRVVDEKIHSSMTKWPDGHRVAAAWAATGAAAVASSPESQLACDVRVSILAQWLGNKRTIAGVKSALEVPDVTRSAAQVLLGELRSVTRSVTGLWDEILTSREALNETWASEATFSASQLEQVHSWCVRQSRVRSEGERDGEEPTLDAEDYSLLLRCWQALRGPLVDPEAKPIRFAHVFIDEVQDASPIELRVLLELTGSERCITLAGDVAQRLLDEADDRGEFDWNGLLDDLGVSHRRIEPLRVSYRSTSQITAFARTVLGPLAHDDAPQTTRNGPPVELFEFGSIGETVAWLAEVLKQLARDEPDANVALITRFAQQADVYFDGLLRAEVPTVRRVAKQDFSWEPGVDVTDVRQTKGLEFDEVVLLEVTAASYPVSPQARHALYIAATRASHQLWCVASDAPSQLVLQGLDGPAPAPSSHNVP